jgi:uncharacterized protein (TIGR02597 family)
MSRFSSIKMVAWCVLLGTAAFSGLRADVASDPAGFYQLTLLGNSDTLVSIPFSRPAAATALVGSISSNVVTVQGLPGWTQNQFVYAASTQTNTYYLRILSGAREGTYFPVVANDTNNVTVSLGGDTLSAVTNGTMVAVVPYWTFATAFPGGHGIFASSSSLIRKTEILIPNYAGVGINLSASASYFLFSTDGTNMAWRKVGGGTTARNDDVLIPDAYVIVRHNIASNSVYRPMGGAPVSRLATPLLTLTTNKQDNPIALVRPVPVSLNDSGLISSGAFVPSVSALNRADELLVFDNTIVGKNKSAVALYYYLTTWRKVGGGTTDFGNDQIFSPGTGVIIRKKSTTNGVASFWVNAPTY